MLDQLKSIVLTGTDGKFAFTGLTPYIYTISALRPDDGIIKYLPVSSNRRSKYQQGPLVNLMIPEDRQDLVEIKVRKATHTKFSGKVVDAQGKPVEGAQVSITKINPNESFSAEYIGMFRGSDKTNQNGEFSLDQPGISVQNQEQISFEIGAITGQTTYKKSEGGGPAEYPHFVPETAGTLSVKGQAGDTFSNLVITISGKFENTLHGRLIAEEENFEPVHLFAIQNSLYLKADTKSDGTFTIANIASGDFTLDITPNFETITETTFEILTEKKYVKEQIKLTMPPNQKEMYVDIKLRRSETLTGTIGYPDGSPLRFAKISVLKEKENDFSGESQTNHKGFFQIPNLTSAASYQLVFIDRETNKKIYTSDWLAPAMDEVHLLVK